MGKKSIKAGDIFETNNCGKFKILNYECWDNITIQFINTGTIKIVNSSSITKGNIKDNLVPSVLNIGFIGYGKYKTKIDKKELPEYTSWKSILRRCYDKVNLQTHPSYLNVEICEEWKNYQNFAEWWNNQYKEENWTLDKDLMSVNCKIYSPETCCYIPKEINMALISENNKDSNLPVGVYIKRDKYGVQLTKYNKHYHFGSYLTPEEAYSIYLIEKKNYIIELANLYKEKLSDKIYNALLNFTIY